MTTLIHEPLAFVISELFTSTFVAFEISIALPAIFALIESHITCTSEIVLAEIAWITGLFAPSHTDHDAYELKIIGSHTHPLSLRMRSSFQVSPHLSEMESHWRKFEAFTFAIVCHGVAAESPSFASLHDVAST